MLGASIPMDRTTVTVQTAINSIGGRSFIQTKDVWTSMNAKRTILDTIVTRTPHAQTPKAVSPVLVTTDILVMASHVTLSAMSVMKESTANVKTSMNAIMLLLNVVSLESALILMAVTFATVNKDMK